MAVIEREDNPELYNIIIIFSKTVIIAISTESPSNQPPSSFPTQIIRLGDDLNCRQQLFGHLVIYLIDHNQLLRQALYHSSRSIEVKF